MCSCELCLFVNYVYLQAVFVDSKSTCIVSEDSRTFVVCDLTIRFNWNLVVWVQLTADPLIHATERFINFLMLEPVIQGFSVMTNYDVSERSNNN